MPCKHNVSWKPYVLKKYDIDEFIKSNLSVYIRFLKELCFKQLSSFCYKLINKILFAYLHCLSNLKIYICDWDAAFFHGT